MALFDAFSYKGKRTLVVGGATGTGAATAELAKDAGADVVIMDVAEPALAGAAYIHANLADKQSIDRAIDQLGGPVNALFSCAGGLRNTDAPGMALLLRKHPSVAQSSQDHHRPGARRRVRGGPDALGGRATSSSVPRAPASPT